MSLLLNILGIATAQATTNAPAAGHESTTAGFLSILPMLIIFIAVFYFLLVRPQTKRAKEQRQLLESLSIGDEVITTGGIIGRLTKLRDNFIVINIAKGVEITLQKNAVTSILPKGTMESVE